MSGDEIEACFAALGVTGAASLTQGGQKLVFTAELAGADVIVKIVPVPPGPSGTIVIERAHREVELLASVESEFVVSVLSDAVEVARDAESSPFAIAWVEERLGGEDLGTALVPGRWPVDRVRSLLHDLAAALDACHSLQVVHRDLSPGNVRVLPDGRFVLMDPGYAKHLRLAAITGHFQPGTDGFRSPEHVAGGNPSSASDVFALGILAFVALTGVFPIDPTTPGYDRRLRHEQAPSILTLRPDLDPGLAAIIDRCLDRQPARRYLDGDELLDALAAIGGHP